MLPSPIAESPMREAAATFPLPVMGAFARPPPHPAAAGAEAAPVIVTTNIAVHPPNL
jgi:hypothetical protein